MGLRLFIKYVSLTPKQRDRKCANRVLQKVNFLSHVLLTLTFLPSIAKARTPRIVCTTSSSHYLGNHDLSSFNAEKGDPGISGLHVPFPSPHPLLFFLLHPPPYSNLLNQVLRKQQALLLDLAHRTPTSPPPSPRLQTHNHQRRASRLRQFRDLEFEQTEFDIRKDQGGYCES